MKMVQIISNRSILPNHGYLVDVQIKQAFDESKLRHIFNATDDIDYLFLSVCWAQYGAQYSDNISCDRAHDIVQN